MMQDHQIVDGDIRDAGNMFARGEGVWTANSRARGGLKQRVEIVIPMPGRLG